jgi:hypothetical protein
MPCHVDPSYRVIYRYFAKLMYLIIEMHTLPSQTTAIKNKTKSLFQFFQQEKKKKKKHTKNVFHIDVYPNTGV